MIRNLDLPLSGSQTLSLFCLGPPKHRCCLFGGRLLAPSWRPLLGPFQAFHSPCLLAAAIRQGGGQQMGDGAHPRGWQSLGCHRF